MNSNFLSYCAFNIKFLDKLIAKTANHKEAILYSVLYAYSFRGSNVSFSPIIITTTILKEYMPFSQHTFLTLLNNLAAKKLIAKKCIHERGIKKLRVTLKINFGTSPVNLKLLKALNNRCLASSESLLFCRILFSCNTTRITHDNKKWSAVSKPFLANHMSLSVRTVDRLIDSLNEKELIDKKIFSWKRMRRLHYSISPYFSEPLHAS